MQNRRKICLVIPSLQAGGMERVMSELAHFFCAKGKYDVHLVLYGITQELFYPIPENITLHKPIFVFNNSKRTYYTIKTLWFLRKTIQALKPDTVLSFGELWNNFVLLACIGLKSPIFVSDRCQPDKSLGALHDKLRNWLYPKATGVICQTQTAKEIYKKMFFHSNFIVIGNPIREIKPNRKIKKKNIVLSVGRLIKSKHHDELIRIFASINQLNWKLVIVGGDALKQQNKINLEALVQELKMKGKIELVGKRDNVDDFYNQAKIFAFTSSSEGFPNVIGEAMAAGLPTVAYDCVAGPSDLIEHEKTGFLIGLHDKARFKQALLKLMEDESLIQEQGRAAMLKTREFSVVNIAEQFEKTILNACSSN